MEADNSRLLKQQLQLFLPSFFTAIFTIFFIGLNEPSVPVIVAVGLMAPLIFSFLLKRSEPITKRAYQTLSTEETPKIVENEIKVVASNENGTSNANPEQKKRKCGCGSGIEIEDFGGQSHHHEEAETKKRDENQRKKVEGMVSVLQMFKIGVGPSSSHTVGPMKAASVFVKELSSKNLLDQVKHIQVDLYGSLALTGVGHATDSAIIIGLFGEEPDSVDIEKARADLEKLSQSKVLSVCRTHDITFDWKTDIIFHKTEMLPFHSNALRITAYNESPLLKKTFYSIGGGFIVDDDVISSPSQSQTNNNNSVPHNFTSAKELLEICKSENKTISEIVMENEKSWRSEEEVRSSILKIWKVMKECVDRGCKSSTQMLPGPLKVKRRAPILYQDLLGGKTTPSLTKNLSFKTHKRIQGDTNLNWLNLFALAVGEENASGGRVVTAPTNGAAGIIPAVLHYFVHFHDHTDDDIITFFLAATAVGHLFKYNASISGAEAGCQGEVGVASSMAAAGLVAVMGGTNEQIEHAAEIAMEHHLGMTCDPIAGLVQVPCIERNTMGALKAVNAAVLSLDENSSGHILSLDQVINAMKSTAADMKDKYKETSTGGLALEFDIKESVGSPVC